MIKKLLAGVAIAAALIASPALAAQTSTLTLPATTAAYTAGQMIAASSGANPNIPSFGFLNGGADVGSVISRVRLDTNDATSTAWGTQTVQVDLWLAKPTFAAGDRSTFSPATGANSHLASFTCQMSAEYGDGAYSECALAAGNVVAPNVPSGTPIYWTLVAVTGSGVTGAGGVFTLTTEYGY